MLTDLKKILTNTKFSILEDYARYYKSISNLSRSEREELKKLIDKDIKNYQFLLDSDILDSSIAACLRFQYVSCYKYNFCHAIKFRSKSENLSVFKKRIKSLATGTFDLYEDKLSPSGALEKELTFALTNEDNFIRTFIKYAKKYLRGSNPYLIYDFFSDYVGFYSPHSTYQDWELDCVKAFEETIESNIHTINYENKKWFPSKDVINDCVERNKFLNTDLPLYLDDIKKYHDQIRDGLNFLRDLREMSFKIFDWTGALETIDAINNGISEKHYLLEKAHDLGVQL